MKTMKHKQRMTGMTKALAYVLTVALILVTIIVPIGASAESESELAALTDAIEDESGEPVTPDPVSDASGTEDDASDKSVTSDSDSDAAKTTDGTADESVNSDESAPKNGGGEAKPNL
jgi:hypothetical protein